MADVEQMLCRWAEAHYELEPESVARVEFEFCEDADYSEMTPGLGPGLEVTVLSVGGDTLKRQEVYDPALIRKILEFAVNG